MQINNLKELLDMFMNVNSQRVKMGITLANLAQHDDVPLHVKVAICTTMYDMIRDMDKELDSDLIKLFNSVFDSIEKDVKIVSGEDLREMMGNLITKAEAITKKREDRIMDGNNILNRINLN